MREYDKLFKLFLRSRDLTVVRKLVDRESDLLTPMVEQLFVACEAISQLSSSSVTKSFGSLILGLPIELQKICFWRYLASQAPTIRKANDLQTTAKCLVATAIEKDAEILLAIRVLDAGLLRQVGNPVQATLLLEKCVEDLLALRKSPAADAWRGEALMQLGYTYQVRGNFCMAEKLYRQSIRLGEQHGFTNLWLRNGVLASLHWASGQFRLALRRHSNAEARAHATEMRDYVVLAWSYLCACKCAIDLKAVARAKSELELVDRTLKLPAAFPPEYRGYAILFRAQICMLEEEYDKSSAGMNDALRVFEAIDPPHHEGVLDTKISMATFAFLSKDYALACATVAKVLEDAEAKGCVNARSRLMVLESCLVVSQNPPLRAGYDDLVHRVHLINNPRLLFLALVNLYHFAIEYLTPADQKFLLARIRNLKPLLKKSCYEELYREYIAATYRDVFEQRLDEIPELTWPEDDGDEQGEAEDENV